MTAESEALADVFIEPRYCIGCGHDERTPLGSREALRMNFIACCQDSKYMTVKEMISAINKGVYEAINADREIRNLRQQLTSLRMKMHPPEPKDVPWARFGPDPSGADWVLDKPIKKPRK